MLRRPASLRSKTCLAKPHIGLTLNTITRHAGVPTRLPDRCLVPGAFLSWCASGLEMYTLDQIPFVLTTFSCSFGFVAHKLFSAVYSFNRLFTHLYFRIQTPRREWPGVMLLVSLVMHALLEIIPLIRSYLLYSMLHSLPFLFWILLHSHAHSPPFLTTVHSY